jgi:uncharacterized protein (DUF427 family)
MILAQSMFGFIVNRTVQNWMRMKEDATYCPYKGDCSYYTIPAGGKKSVNAVWSYEDPFPAVEQIRAHVAFYPGRVDEIAEQHN